MIPVFSILEVRETYGSLGVSYLSLAFGEINAPKRMTHIPVRDLDGITINSLFVPSEVL